MTNLAIKREKNDATITGVGIHEPKVTEDNYRIDLILALNWYNVSRDDKAIKNYALTFVKTHYPQYLTAVTKADENELRQIGTLGRLIVRKQYISPEHQELIQKQLETINPIIPSVVTVVTTAAPKVNVQLNIKESANKYATAVDEAIDDYIRTKSSKFDMKEYLMTNTITGIVAKRIGEIYTPLYNELTSPDPEIQEGYNFTRLELRRFAAFIKTVIDCCNQHGVSARVRKPRVVKTKPAVVVTAKVNYLKEFPELKLKSIEPSKLVGAKEIWLYNTVYRKISVIRGADDGTLLIRGTSIYNQDLEKSEVKMIRNPEDFFGGIKTIGKRALTSGFKSLTTKASLAKGRLNDQSIILAAY